MVALTEPTAWLYQPRRRKSKAARAQRPPRFSDMTGMGPAMDGMGQCPLGSGTGSGTGGSVVDPATIDPTHFTLWGRVQDGCYNNIPPTILAAEGDSAQSILNISPIGLAGSEYYKGAATPPTYHTGTGPNGKNIVTFDGSNDFLAGNNNDLSGHYLTASAFTMFFTVAIHAVVSTNTLPYQNDIILADENGYVGLSVVNLSGVLKIRGWNYDGAVNVLERDLTLDVYQTIMLRHEGGNLYYSRNNDAETTVASGNTALLTALFRMGAWGSNTHNCNMSAVEYMVWNSALGSTDTQSIWDYHQDRFGLW